MAKNLRIQALLIIVMNMVLIIIFLPQEHPTKQGGIAKKSNSRRHD